MRNFDQWLERISIGALPSIANSEEPFEDLKDYVGLYVREEIIAEGLSRSIKNFSRFLDLVALSNTEQIYFTSLGSDAQLAPSTVRDYFEVLSDTLIGHSLPAFLATKKRKAMTTAKFYLFDCGVANSLLNRKQIAWGTPEFGKLLEQAIFMELETYISYHHKEVHLEFWRSTSQCEVDFLVYENPEEIIAIEVKSNANPSLRDYKGLMALEDDVRLKRKIVVCSTSMPRLTKEGVEIIPIETFLKELWTEQIF